MRESLQTKNKSTLSDLLRSIGEQTKTRTVMVNGQPYEMVSKQFSDLARQLGTSEVVQSHSLTEGTAHFQRWQLRAGGKGWAIGNLRDDTDAESFVQMPIDLMLKSANGADCSVGRPDGSVLSPFAAGGIKAAARLLKPPKSLKHLNEYDRNREVVRLYIEDFKNKQNFAIFPRLFKSDFKHHFHHEGLKGDMKSWVMTGQDFLRGFPDVQVRIRHLIVEGDYVLEHNLARGHHRGVFRGVSATNRQTTWPEMHLYRLRDGQIVENWPMVGFPQILDQLR